jgi:hypothetical protein
MVAPCGQIAGSAAPAQKRSRGKLMRFSKDVKSAHRITLNDAVMCFAFGALSSRKMAWKA